MKKSNDHRGIRVENLDKMDLDSSGTFVQEYIQKPFLIDGKQVEINYRNFVILNLHKFF